MKLCFVLFTVTSFVNFALSVEMKEEVLSDLRYVLDKQVEVLNALQGQQAILDSLQEQQRITSDQVSDLATFMKSAKITNECSEGRHNCSPHGSCEDTYLHFACSCDPGFRGDGVSCEDIDECTEGLHDCLDDASCNNTPGNYSCACSPPLLGDGHICHLPCEEGHERVLGLGCLMTTPEEGSWYEVRRFCASKGARLLQGFRRDHFSALSASFELFNYTVPWVGVEDEVWEASKSPVASDLWAPDHPHPFDEAACGMLILGRHDNRTGIQTEPCSFPYGFGLCQAL